MSVALSNDIRKLIDGPNFGHLATLMADGSPQSDPVWIDRENDTILICTSGNSLKGRNTERDPRVALSLVDFHDPYAEAQIRGRVVERRPDQQFKCFDAMSMKYTGKPWPYREEKGAIVLVIEATKAHYAKQPFAHTPAKRGGS